MAKIIKFKTNSERGIEYFLDNVKKQVIEEHIDNMLLVCKCKDNTVLTGYTGNLDWRSKTRIIRTCSNGYNK